MQYPDISYNSVENLPYYNFIEVLKTGDLNWIGKHDDQAEVWLNIQNEYCIIAKIDNTNIKQQAKVIGLEWKHSFLSKCLEIVRYSHLLDNQGIEGFKEMKDTAMKKMSNIGYIWNGNKDFEDEYQRIKRALGGLLTKIEIEKSKIEKDNKKQAVNLWKELVQLERAVPQIKVDPYKDPVAKVVEVHNLAKEISNEQRNHRHNNRR